MKRFTVPLFTCFFTVTVWAQTSISYYHLGNATFQNSALNPAWIPEGKLFIGLPVLSGIHVHANSSLSYNDLFTKENDQVTIDFDKALSTLKRQNIASVQANINLLHIGYTLDSGPTVSVFANERIEGDLLYPKDLVGLVWNGNGTFLNEKVEIGQGGIRVTHFREVGIGFATPLSKRLDFGLRAKYLMGMLDMSTPGNLKAHLITSGSAFQLEGELQNAQVRTSGVEIYEEEVGDLESHLVKNGNTGLAIDIGAEYKLSGDYSIAGSLLDVGWINWKENIVNHTLNDTTFTYNGINLDGAGDIRQALRDSLFEKFNPTKTNEPYRGWLPVKAYGSWIYHYDQRTDFYVTTGARFIQERLKILYGGGATRELGKALTVSLSAIKMPHQFFNVGVACAVNGGPVQLYIAADQVINISAPNFKAFDFRFGINFQFRRRQTTLTATSSPNRGSIGDAKGYDTNIFLGNRVRTKRRDGIYSIIKKQKPRKIDHKKIKTKKVVRKSLTGRKKTKPKH